MQVFGSDANRGHCFSPITALCSCQAQGHLGKEHSTTAAQDQHAGGFHNTLTTQGRNPEEGALPFPQAIRHCKGNPLIYTAMAIWRVNKAQEAVERGCKAANYRPFMGCLYLIIHAVTLT